MFRKLLKLLTNFCNGPLFLSLTINVWRVIVAVIIRIHVTKKKQIKLKVKKV